MWYMKEAALNFNSIDKCISSLFKKVGDALNTKAQNSGFLHTDKISAMYYEGFPALQHHAME